MDSGSTGWPFGTAQPYTTAQPTYTVTTTTQPFHCSENIHVFGCEHCTVCKCGVASRQALRITQTYTQPEPYTQPFYQPPFYQPFSTCTGCNTAADNAVPFADLFKENTGSGSFDVSEEFYDRYEDGDDYDDYDYDFDDDDYEY